MQTSNLLDRVRDLLKSDNLIAALQLCENNITESPDCPEILAITAIVHRKMNSWVKAAEVMEKVVKLEPENQSMLVSYSMDLLRLGRITESDSVLEKIKPSYRNDPQYMLQMGLLHYHKHEFEDAIKILVKLVNQHRGFTTSRLELAHALLMHGKWRAGWDAYEGHYQSTGTISELPKFRIPRWDGKKLDKRILLIADQGLSECLLFCRYIPMVAERCKAVILFRSEPVGRLLDSVPGINFSCSKWEEVSKAAKYCTMSGLPRLFSTTPDTVPDGDGLIKIHGNLEWIWREKIIAESLRAKLRIGIAWSARLDPDDNYLGAIPVDKIKSLLGFAGCEFFSLQVGKFADQADELDMINMTDRLTDFTETAAMMQTLDLIITSDSSIAHLAGTLGRPTWVCLAYTPDWCWGVTGNRTRWYKSIYMFRQTAARSWDTVIAEVKNHLNNIVSQPDPLSALSEFMCHG